MGAFWETALVFLLLSPSCRFKVLFCDPVSEVLSFPLPLSSELEELVISVIVTGVLLPTVSTGALVVVTSPKEPSWVKDTGRATETGIVTGIVDSPADWRDGCRTAWAKAAVLGEFGKRVLLWEPPSNSWIGDKTRAPTTDTSLVVWNCVWEAL